MEQGGVHAGVRCDVFPAQLLRLSKMIPSLLLFSVCPSIFSASETSVVPFCDLVVLRERDPHEVKPRFNGI